MIIKDQWELHKWELYKEIIKLGGVSNPKLIMRYVKVKGWNGQFTLEKINVVESKSK